MFSFWPSTVETQAVIIQSTQVEQPLAWGTASTMMPPSNGVAWAKTSAVSSVPIIYDFELKSQYATLATALTEMKELDADEIGAISPDVYDAARFIAAELYQAKFPPPKVFTHGPSSVVFNWEKEHRNLYLTVSSDRFSALLTSPAEIQRRIDYRNDELTDTRRVMLELRAGHTGETVTARQTASSVFVNG